MRVGEYGFTIRINTDFDLSGNTAMELNITHPDTTKTTHPMTLGTTEVIADGLGVFKAAEYAEYIVQPNDFTQVGAYSVFVQADFGAGQRLKSADGIFEMEA